MKRLLALLLVFGLIAAACGSDDDDDNGDTGSATTAPSDDMTDDMTDDMMTPDVLNVAYFEQWPTPNQAGQEDGSFEEAVGVPINWIPLGTGGQMAEAMLSGDVDIAYSMGLTPFANNVNGGADLKMVGVAVSYSEADNCVAQGSLGVTKENASETLVGAKIMSPTGNITHFKLLSTLEFFGISLDDIEFIANDDGAAIAAAFESGEIDVGCAFGGPVVNMLDNGGNVILTGAEAESDLGIFTYDIVAIPSGFGETYPDVVTSFLAATEDFNNKWAANAEEWNPIIAQAAGMEDVGNFLAGDLWFAFPSIADQLGPDWLGGAAADNMAAQVQTFVDLGLIESIIDDFGATVDPSFLEAVG
ncbi:MAG: ABC transporter substrate-binding protein [Acidimicrobiales bacterium]|nr:ABC transporter substrate-binding protein [Acidimicrobiales bacterium]